MSQPLLTVEVVTLFPEMFASVLAGSLLGRAIERGLVQVHFTDPRAWGLGRHRAVDDAPYGGGGGMVMRPEPLVAAIEEVERLRGPAHKVLLGPAGARLERGAVERLCRLPRLLLLCGRYEGIDHRVGAFVDEEISLGDFVLSGGEIAAMALIDACARRLPGVLGNQASPVEESFEEALLEHPQYTRPPDFRGLTVPEVLHSGDHQRVRRHRRLQSLLRTQERRPDLFARHRLTDEDRKLLAEPPGSRTPAPAAVVSGRAQVAARTFVALCHHPVRGRDGATITTAVTNLDIHDLARACRSYGVAGLFLVTPIDAQRELCTSILEGWRAEGAARNDHRMEALSRVAVAASIEEAQAAVAARAGQAPLRVATSARAVGGPAPTVEAADLVAELTADPTLARRPVLLLFGTGWGLADGVLDRVDRVLAPLQGASDYNHLSVRSAAAVTLDRLFAEPRRDST